jgi:hypothetical protein
MIQSLSKDIQVWDGEGGTALDAAFTHPRSLSGTPSQVEWADRIRNRVSEEFDRVAHSLRSAALKQSDADRADTQAILAILEEKRAAAMDREQAGYFIRDWQEITDQVRQMIGQDSRYRAIKSRKAARRA